MKIVASVRVDKITHQKVTAGIESEPITGYQGDVDYGAGLEGAAEWRFGTGTGSDRLWVVRTVTPCTNLCREVVGRAGCNVLGLAEDRDVRRCRWLEATPPQSKKTLTSSNGNEMLRSSSSPRRHYGTQSIADGAGSTSASVFVVVLCVLRSTEWQALEGDPN